MKKLNSKQLDFLKKEFGIEEINYSDKEKVEEIRLKCFDIECDECFDRLEKGIDESSIGKRGNMAVAIIDALQDIINE